MFSFSALQSRNPWSISTKTEDRFYFPRESIHHGPPCAARSRDAASYIHTDLGNRAIFQFKNSHSLQFSCAASSGSSPPHSPTKLQILLRPPLPSIIYNTNIIYHSFKSNASSSPDSCFPQIAPLFLKTYFLTQKVTFFHHFRSFFSLQLWSSDAVRFSV